MSATETAEPAALGTEASDVPALEVEALSHDFGPRCALDQVSLTIRPGAFTVLPGQNGAGKTTLFSLVTRLYGNRIKSVVGVSERGKLVPRTVS